MERLKVLKSPDENGEAQLVLTSEIVNKLICDSVNNE